MRFILLVCLLAALAACAPRPAPQPAQFDPAGVNGRRALDEARDFISLGPRVAGTPGAKNAADHIAARLQNMGIEPVVDEFTDITPNGDIVLRNITALIPGNSDEMLILAGHYDTKAGIAPDFAGANDSGSSTGLLLELARILMAYAANFNRETIKGDTGRSALDCAGLTTLFEKRRRAAACLRAYTHRQVLQKMPPASTKRLDLAQLPSVPDIMIAFLDGEECAVRYGARDGLHGSRRLARQLEQEDKATRVKAVIVLDMVGDRDLTITIPPDCSPELIDMVFKSAREENARRNFSLFRSSITDDHVPFMEAGMPAIDIIDFEFGAGPGKNDYWHTAEDTSDKLSAESLELVGRVTIRTLNKLIARAGLDPPRNSH